MRRLAMAMLLLLGCPNRGGNYPQNDRSPHVCSGQLDIVVDETGKQTGAKLLCDDVCDDGTPCREMMNEAKTHAWCGCPGQPEPTQCHLSKDLTGAAWEPHCGETCPAEGDRCTLAKDETIPDAAARRSTVSCECENPDDQ